MPEGTLWHAVGKPITGLGAGKYRLNAHYLFFEKGTLSLNAQQIPVAAIFDVDAKQSMTQKARGVGSITLTVHRANRAEIVLIEDIPNFREGVEAINSAAHAARIAIQRQAQTQTVQYSGVSPHAGAPQQTGPTAPAETPTPQPDVFSQLRQLGELRDAGVLTPEEFEAKKADLLSRM